MTSPRRVAAAVLCFSLLVSCSAKHAGAPAKSAGNASASPHASATVQRTGGSPNAATKPVILPTGDLSLSSCPGFKLTARPALKAGDPYLIALVPVTGPFGTCDSLVPGRTCRLPFGGGWDLMHSPKGYLVYQVYENGATKPLENLRFGPVPPRGTIEPDMFGVTYTVGKGARTVTFRWLLLDVTGRVVAQSQSETLPIPTCRASGE